MKSIKEIRRLNLLALVKKYDGPGVFLQMFAPHYGEGNLSPSYLSQLMSGKASIGDATADKLVRAVGLPPHSLDREPNDPAGSKTDGVPVISWAIASTWHKVENPFEPGLAEAWLPCPIQHGERTFALRVRGESMENAGDRHTYSDGDIIYVDPDKLAENGARVIVRQGKEKEVAFKQLVIEGDNKFLKALNPLWPDRIIEMGSNAVICGVVIGKWVQE